MPIRLTASRGGQPIKQRVLGEGTHVIGSAPDCDLIVADPTVSRRHLQIELAGDLVRVTDLGSSNGTLLGPRRLSRDDAVPWSGEPPLRLGEVHLVWQPVEAGDERVGLAVGGPAPDEEGRRNPTLDAGSFNRFLIERLPDLLQQVRAGMHRRDLARLVGEALMETVACRYLKISGADDAVLFRAGEAESSQSGAAVAVEDGGYRASVLPELAEQRSLHQSLLRIALGLMLLGRDDEEPPAPSPAADLPPPRSLDPVVRRIYGRAARAAHSRLNVLIRGESGTGKEMLARYLHRHLNGGRSPFVAVNCSALPENLLEAELFGIEKGVATGVDARPGQFEQAHGGVLFLDEIGDMPPATQARILRALQERAVVRVGGTRSRPAEVMVVSATNRDLDAMIARGEFRLDLFHRLADWEVELPPLRERPLDIPNLALWFLARAAEASGTPVAGLSERAVNALLASDWPGNVRQLEREMKRLAAFAGPGDVITSEDLDPRIAAAAEAAPLGGSLDQQLARAERRIIETELLRHDHNVSRTAEALGVSRSTLYRRLEQLGISAT